MKKKQLLIYEYNGISGEFNEKIPKPLKAMFKIVNIIPTIFSDFTYCVNDSIREKLKIYSNIDKLFVCENGGPAPIETVIKIKNMKVAIVFYGGDQGHYEINEIVQGIANNPDVELHLIGPNLNHYSSLNVFCPGAMSLEQLSDYITSLECPCFGITPLKNILNDNKARPIKVFDYMSLGLPLLHTEYCLSSFDPQKKFSISYNSIENILHELRTLTLERYLIMREESKSDYHNYLWEATLIPLYIVIDKKY